MPDTTSIVHNFEKMRCSGQLLPATQARADEISGDLVLANEHGGERYFATIRRADAFLKTAIELGLYLPRAN